MFWVTSFPTHSNPHHHPHIHHNPVPTPTLTLIHPLPTPTLTFITFAEATATSPFSERRKLMETWNKRWRWFKHKLSSFLRRYRKLCKCKDKCLLGTTEKIFYNYDYGSRIVMKAFLKCAEINKVKMLTNLRTFYANSYHGDHTEQ